MKDTGTPTPALTRSRLHWAVGCVVFLVIAIAALADLAGLWGGAASSGGESVGAIASLIGSAWGAADSLQRCLRLK